jgi:hypothetical protein
MTSAELVAEIFRSSDFREGLQELSSYLSSIMQEGPIVHLLAKCLWKRNKYDFRLEHKDRDLMVNGKHAEFKFTYDWCGRQIAKELAQWPSLKDMWMLVQRGQLSCNSWAFIPKVYKDVCQKEPDLFVWIICARDLTGLPEAEVTRICRASEQIKSNEQYPFETDHGYLAIADLLLQRLNAERRFNVLKGAIPTMGAFPSVYHFRICDFG